MLNNSSILVTGGTGSFGSTFIPMTLKKYNPRRIVVFSRDEMKQWDMAKLYKDDPRIRFFIGDVRDKDRLCRALDGIDYISTNVGNQHQWSLVNTGKGAYWIDVFNGKVMKFAQDGMAFLSDIRGMHNYFEKETKYFLNKE